MQSEGVGKMELCFPHGEKFPGFDSVVFAKPASEKLASVGEICDARFIYVFTKDGSSTYKEDSVTISGKKFRDKKT